MAVELELVRTGLYLEALAIEDDAIWYGDVMEGGVHRIGMDDADLGHWLPERGWIGGILLNQDGALLVSGQGGIAWVNPHTGRSGTLIDAVEGQPLSGVNEMIADGEGGVYFGTSDLDAIARGKRPGLASICHVDRDGHTRRLVEGLSFSNGMALSPDGQALYHNESFSGVRGYAVLPDGRLGDELFFTQKYDCDGMALDVEGNLWISGFTVPELLCLSPAGEVLDRIALPDVATTNIRFGGADGRDLYLTTITPEASAMLARGEALTAPTSRLCRMRAPVKGAPVQRAGFTLF